MTDKIILVLIDLAGKTQPVGRLFCHSHNGRESASFLYDETWLNNPDKFALEPAVQLTAGKIQTKGSQKLFGALGDSAPDRWGRELMKHAAAKQARERKQTPPSLTEADFLLGVNDKVRLGALRFSLPENSGIYFEHESKNPIPPLMDLPKLLSASDNFLSNKETAKELQLLLEPGSSLGGARAKASVLDGEDLYIAKFPQKSDTHKVILWEIITLDLAKKAGLTLPENRSLKIKDSDILLLKRFDRKGTERIPFLSAMAMLGAQDGEDGHNYLEIADALSQYGAAPKADLEQLWRRIIFTVLISNTDDHLRNHDFLYDSSGRGWRLSPAYDMNPTPNKYMLSTAITDSGEKTASLALALPAIKYFRLEKNRAEEIIREVSAAARQWRTAALQFGAERREIDYMASAFEHEESEKAAKF